jgi:phosphatidylserine decarboxylase
MDISERKLDEKYRRHFGYQAGYLPRDRSAVDAFQAGLLAAAYAQRGDVMDHVPSVEALAALIESDGVIRMYVQQMIEQQPADHAQISTVDQLLIALDQIVTTAPVYAADPAKSVAFPMSALFTYMMMTPAGEALFRMPAFNHALSGVLKAWCRYLDSPASCSVLTEGPDGWLSQSAYWYNRLFEFETDPKAPHWGFTSFNAYFHREIRPEARPIGHPDDPKAIVSANDGTVFNIAFNVQRLSQFWLKGQPYSLLNMLDGCDVDRFVGGTVFQSFLSGANYHRWRAPIDGTVVEQRVVNGLLFSDAESAGVDTTAATYSQGYGACVNTRGLVFIESDDPAIGRVCVIPIGITEISSVTISVRKGQKVKKGQELGWFSYGGSGMALVFQPGAIDRFTVPNRSAGDDPDGGPPIRVNQQIAWAR